jgi:hypothetical protein
MRNYLALILMFSATLGIAQKPSSEYQPGTIMAVTTHQNPGPHDTDVTRYDVSVRVGDTTYAVLYTPPVGSNTVKFAAGLEMLFLVGDKTLTFNTVAAGKTELPILSRATLPTHAPDWSKVCSEYFSLKLQHLTEKLSLTEDQRSKIKPILEQEAGEVGEICGNPALSQKDVLKQYEKILSGSDERIRPLLSASQLKKLQVLRTDQKQDVKKLIDAQMNGKQA